MGHRVGVESCFTGGIRYIFCFCNLDINTEKRVLEWRGRIVLLLYNVELLYLLRLVINEWLSVAADKGSRSRKLKHDVIEAINDLIQDIATCHEQIAEQAVEHIHQKYVLVSYSMFRIKCFGLSSLSSHFNFYIWRKWPIFFGLELRDPIQRVYYFQCFVDG